MSLLEFKFEGHDYCIANIYAPNVDNTDYLEKLFRDMYGRGKDDFLILAGDWNTVLDNELDKLGGNPQHSNRKCQALLNTSMNELGLHDPFRLHNGSDRKYTHFNKRCKTASRLDFFLVDNNVINFKVCSSTITHGFRSDHSYVQLELQGNKIERGRGYWKLNNSLISDPEYNTGVRNIISNTLAENFDSWGGLWDVIKFKIKDFSIRAGKKKKKVNNERKIRIENKISDLKNDIKNRNNDQQALDELFVQLHNAQNQLNSIISDEIKGIITRSRIQWVEEGERSTKYFMGLEKASQKKKSITKLMDESRNILTTQEDISEHVVTFYQSLFSSKQPNARCIEDYLKDSKLDEIDQDLKKELDNPIHVDELDAVVKALKVNKSPGWDGLTSEFYKEFWSCARPILVNVINESVANKILPPSMRIGVITLIPKPKPPPELNYIKNWRPITLLNNDYKIIAHVIKNRLLRSIPTLISKSQSGFQAGKSTNDNLILMYLVLEHFNNNPEDEGLLVQVDYEKAFDSVEHSFLYASMKHMGFGNNIIDLVKLIFQGCLSYANVNGHLSTPIYIGRGLHQGSPLSPILFLIVAQVFTKNITNNSDIRGISVEGVELLHSLFADDTDLFLEASESVIAAVFHELQLFGRNSGCRFNVGKTRCIPLGKTRSNPSLINRLIELYGSSFVPEDGKFSALGINFCNGDLNCIIQNNYSAKLEKACNLARLWGMRDMTIYGRITLIKTFLLSQFVYLIVPLPKPDNIMVKNINTLLYKFLWGGGRDKIKRETADQPKDAGGLDMVNFESFILGLKVKMLYKLLNNGFEHPWKNIVLKQLEYPGFTNISIEVGAVRDSSRFTKDLLDSYRQWKNKVASCREMTVNECVWGNRVVSGSSGKLWNNVLIDRRVMYLADFLNSEGGLLTYDELRYKHNIRHSLFSKNDYVTIKMVLRRYHTPSNCHKSLNNIDASTSLTVFYVEGALTPCNAESKHIRHMMVVKVPKFDSAQLKDWSGHCRLQSSGNIELDWCSIFRNLYNITNHFKLVQHQYKIIMKIATCKYS